MSPRAGTKGYPVLDTRQIDFDMAFGFTREMASSAQMNIGANIE